MHNVHNVDSMHTVHTVTKPHDVYIVDNAYVCNVYNVQMRIMNNVTNVYNVDRVH